MVEQTLDPDLEKLVNTALNKAVQARGPIKLYHGKYDKEGLFDKKRVLEKKAAIHGFGSKPALWREEDRSSLNQTLFVRLLPGGLERLIEVSQPNQRVELIESASELYRRELLERWSDIAAARGWKNDFPKIATCCESLISKLQKLVPEASQKTAETKPVNSQPLDADGADFKRRMAHELVIAWKHSANEDAKNSIATALKNSGVEQIGQKGETTPMDGGLHRCDGPAFPGDKVEVVESGWLVHDGVGEYLLEKAIVKLS